MDCLRCEEIAVDSRNLVGLWVFEEFTESQRGRIVFISDFFLKGASKVRELTSRFSSFPYSQIGIQVFLIRE